jgi:hypothetical protein
VTEAVKALHYEQEGHGFDSRYFRPLYDSGVDKTSKRNGYQESFLGVKAAGTFCLQPYLYHKPNVFKSESLRVSLGHHKN